MTDIAKNLAEVQRRMADAALRAGRAPSAVTLVAVSKNHPAQAVREAYGAGQRNFGENYAQELKEKADALADLPGIAWHFIGHLQRNKARQVVPRATVLETIDSVRLAEEAARQAARSGRALDCLVQVNVGQERQKSGCDPAEVGALLEAVERLDGLCLKGLMTIPPFDLEAEETRRYFVALRRLRDVHGGEARLPHLSMGMSGDFETAIAEGSTIVRVGTAVFGPRA